MSCFADFFDAPFFSHPIWYLLFVKYSILKNNRIGGKDHEKQNPFQLEKLCYLLPLVRLEESGRLLQFCRIRHERKSPLRRRRLQQRQDERTAELQQVDAAIFPQIT